MKTFKDIFKFGSDFQSAQVEETHLPVSSPRAGLKGRTLLFFSDVHLSNMFPIPSLERLMAQVEALHPDMILLGGDYAESVEWQNTFFRLLSQIPTPLGKYGVIGNNDTECFPDNLNSLLDIASTAGVRLLYNETVRFSMGDNTVSIAGISDFRYTPQPNEALFHEQDASAFRILLAHYPQSIARYLNMNHPYTPELSFAGHTHGGQFSLFGITPYSIGFEYRMKGIDLPVVCGWRELNGTRLLVSSGIGTSRLPFRVNVPPTIHRIFL